MCGYSFTNDAGWYLSSKRRTKTGRHLTDSPPARTNSSACPRLHWTVRYELLWALFFCNCHRRIRCYCLFFFFQFASFLLIEHYRMGDNQKPWGTSCRRLHTTDRTVRIHTMKAHALPAFSYGVQAPIRPRTNITTTKYNRIRFDRSCWWPLKRSVINHRGEIIDAHSTSVLAIMAGTMSLAINVRISKGNITWCLNAELCN